MLISTGRVPHSEEWRILEVAIGQAPDVLAIRLTKELKRLHEPAQALVPFTPNAAGAAEWIVPHIYVRGLNGSFSSIARTPGIEFARKEIAPADWISQLMQCEQSNQQLAVGSFVRILTGPCARLCGHISEQDESSVTVQIVMPTKRVKVHTNPQNVQLIECPPDKQSFYFAEISA